MPTSTPFAVCATAAAAVAAVKQSGGAKRVPKPLVWDPNRHLLSRFAFGPWGAQAAGAPDKWFDAQIALGTRTKGYAGLPELAGLYPYLARSVAQTRMQLGAEGNQYGGTSMDQLTKATLALQAWSPAQLYETVVDFFANRLNVANYSDTQQSMRLSYDRDVVRANAFGKYRDMLVASTKHPSMLKYLDNDQSTFVAPNENLGRELLELHTVGIGSGYTQADVVDSAKILTGRGVDSRFWDYSWSNGAHFPGAVKVLGFTDANPDVAKGEEVGDAYVAYLASHPATAASLARALCVRYVSDTPSDALVGAVAKAYLDNDTAIVPMLRTIVRSTEFWDSRGRKLKRPLEAVVSTLRVLQIQPVDLDRATSTLSWQLQQLGQRPLACSAPPGYVDVQTPWLSAGALLRLWNFQLGYVQGWGTEFAKPAPEFLYGGTTPATVTDAFQAMAKTLLGGITLTTTEVYALLEYLGESPGLAVSRSKLSWLQRDVAGLLLHTAHHHLR